MSELLALFKLLDDENEPLVQHTLSALLKYSDEELNPLLAEIQESTNPLLRRRAHQLTSIMIMRRRRRDFYRLLRDPNVDLIDGLIEAHLQWFDNDNSDLLADEVKAFFAASKNFSLTNVEKLAAYLRTADLELPSLDGVLFPDNYCIGQVLESGKGADVILCILAKELAKIHGLDSKIVRILANFALLFANGQILVPTGGWQISAQFPDGHEEYRNDQLLRYVIQSLFTYAVEADSFRYIHILACAVTGNSGDHAPDSLPYPFCGPEE